MKETQEPKPIYEQPFFKAHVQRVMLVYGMTQTEAINMVFNAMQTEVIMASLQNLELIKHQLENIKPSLN